MIFSFPSPLWNIGTFTIIIVSNTFRVQGAWNTFVATGFEGLANHAPSVRAGLYLPFVQNGRVDTDSFSFKL